MQGKENINRYKSTTLRLSLFFVRDSTELELKISFGLANFPQYYLNIFFRRTTRRLDVCEKKRKVVIKKNGATAKCTCLFALAKKILS